jgi:hypothetical protein
MALYSNYQKRVLFSESALIKTFPSFVCIRLPTWGNRVTVSQGPCFSFIFSHTLTTIRAEMVSNYRA